MAIDAKMSFMSQIEQSLAAELTVESMNRVLKAVSAVTDNFEMREIVRWDEGEDDLLEYYLGALKVEGRSQKTIDLYRYILTRMKKFCGVPVRKITIYHLREYIAKEKERGLKDSTLESHREIFGAFFNWLHRENLIEKNPVANLGVIKRQKKKRKILTDVEIEKLTASCGKTKCSLRNRAIIEFLKTTGCRISEMTGLNRDSVDFQRMEVVVLGKGNKERTVYLSPVAAMILKEYLDSRKDEDPALFYGYGKMRMNPNGVREMLKKLGKMAGVENVHPHKFRRTLATNLNRRGMKVQEVAAILGHENLDTTMKYVNLDHDAIRNDFQRRYA